MSKDYNDLFKQDAEAFMKKYSCNPTGNIEGNIGVQVGTPFAIESADTYRFRAMTTGETWLDFQKIKQETSYNARLAAWGQYQATGQIFVTGSYTRSASKVWSYWLPWTDESIIKINIPPKNNAFPSPDYFFTAAINGCSIFIQGTQQHPIVFHAGGKTGQNDPSAGARFWRDLMPMHYQTRDQNVAEVNKTDYITDKVRVTKKWNEVATHADGGYTTTQVDKLGTAHSRKFAEWVKKEVSGDYLVESVEPTGCVMGMRDPSGDWSFYLQENASIKYYKYTKSKSGFFGGATKTKIDTSMNMVMRPMQFTQIFPGQGHVKFKPSLSRVLKD